MSVHSTLLVALVVKDHWTSGRESSTCLLVVLVVMDHLTSGRESSTCSLVVSVVTDHPHQWKGEFYLFAGSFSGHEPPD